MIDKAVREKVLSNYMELSRCRHCIIFARWRLHQINKGKGSLKEVGKMFIEENKSADKRIDNEVDYLMDLHKFRTQKAK